MDYIIFDLELNSKIFKSRLPNEIIEIGAVKLDHHLLYDSSFQSFIKPKIYKKLFPVIKRKTGISQCDINDARNFGDIISSFKEWIGQDYILCSWGHDDIHHMKTNCSLHRMGSSWLKNPLDIQKVFSELYQSPPGQRFSLKKALHTLEIPVDEKLHRACTDAKYTAEIFTRIYDNMKSGIPPKAVPDILPEAISEMESNDIENI